MQESSSTHDQAEIGVVSHPAIAAIYQWQIDAGNGPMIQAFNQSTALYVADLSLETRWPDWR
jgi:hypothetical protein